MDTKAIRARCDAATKGPWYAEDGENTWSLHQVYGPLQILKAPKRGTPYAEYWPNKADAALITHARTDLPACLDTIEAQAQRIEVLEKALADAHKLIRDQSAEINRQDKILSADKGTQP